MNRAIWWPIPFGENYGWAGKEFIEYVKLISVEELRARYKLIFDEIMQKCDTTDKQAYSMALILLADELSCSSIFPQDRPIRVEDIRQYLHSNKAVDIAERAYEWCINWIARNQNRFSPEQGGEIWGKIEKEFALVNKEVLVEQLRLGGFEYGSVSVNGRRTAILFGTAREDSFITPRFMGQKRITSKSI